MFCTNCGQEVNEKAVICVHCGVSLNSSDNNNEPVNDSKMAIIGFILAIISMVLPIAIIDIVLGVIALVLSSISLIKYKSNRGFAIAGLIISLLATFGAINLLIHDPDFYLF